MPAIERFHQRAFQAKRDQWFAQTEGERAAAKTRELQANRRIRGLVANMNRRIATYLCRHEVVLLPWFAIKRMVKNPRSPLPPHVKRCGLSQSPYQFKQRVIDKARQTGTRILLCSETHTSGTCGACWMWNAGLGARKTFRCRFCQYVADRDHNGARNIFIRSLGIAPEFHDAAVIEAAIMVVAGVLAEWAGDGGGGVGGAEEDGGEDGGGGVGGGGEDFNDGGGGGDDDAAELLDL